MADRRATLWLELKDLASKPLKSFVDVWALGKTAIEAFNLTFGKALEFMKDSVAAFAESEKAISALNQALRNQGFYSAEYSAALQKQAEELQSVSTFSDETILSTQTLLTTFGLAGDQLTQTTKSAMDLSVGLGVDLRTATLLLGKAWAGETQTLARYGLKVDETRTATERFADLESQISSRFGGASQAAADTYAGKVEKLKNNFDDLKEKIGKELLPIANKWLDWMNQATTAGNQLLAGQAEYTRKFADRNTDSLNKQLEYWTQVQTLLKQRNESGTTMGKEAEAQVNRLTAALEKLKALGGAGVTPYAPPKPESTNAAIDAEIAAERRKQAELEEIENFGLAESARKKLESYTLTKDQIEAMEVERLASSLRRDDQHEAAKALLNAHYLTTMKNQGMIALNNLSALQRSKNKQMAAVGKAAAISQATIQTYLGATSAYAALAPIPIVGPALATAAAAAAIVAGLANVAAISGTPLAQGGMMLARPGGVHVRMAEAGHDEVAIPLDDERTTERLRNTMGGGDHYHFHVGTLVANDAGLMELARKVDENLFKLGRRNARVS